MSYYLIKPSNIDTFNFDNIVIGNNTSDDIAKYFLYYTDNNKLCEIYIMLPKVRLIYDTFKNMKYNRIKLPLYPKWDETNKFISFIRKLEKYISSCFKKVEINSLIDKYKTFKQIKFNINNQPKISSDCDVKTFDEFSKNSEIEVVLKISSIWKKDGHIGLTSELYQIKYYGLPTECEIDFFKTEKKIMPMPPIPPPKKENIVIPQKMILNDNILMDAIKSLKKVV